MLLQLISRIGDNPFGVVVTFLAFALSLVVAITFHEFSHALVATRLGDSTAMRLGRLSLNPKAHLDPLGTAMILVAGFGWGKPVPVDPGKLRTDPRMGMAAVSLAGPLSNIILAALLALPIKVGAVSPNIVGFSIFRGDPADIPSFVFGSLIFWNLLLAAFNLIPIAPLDGFKVLLGLLPRNLANSFARLEPYGPVILLLIIMFDVIAPGPGILSFIIRPILRLLTIVLVG